MISFMWLRVFLVFDDTQGEFHHIDHALALVEDQLTVVEVDLLVLKGPFVPVDTILRFLDKDAQPDVEFTRLAGVVQLLRSMLHGLSGLLELAGKETLLVFLAIFIGR